MDVQERISEPSGAATAVVGRRRAALAPTIAVVVACAFSSACTAWHTTSLDPQRFSADTSPEQARLTFSDGSEVTARHPVIVGDTLVWAARSGRSSGDAARNAVPASSIRQVQLRRVDAPRTIFLLAALGGLVLGVRAMINGYVTSLD